MSCEVGTLGPSAAGDARLEAEDGGFGGRWCSSSRDPSSVMAETNKRVREVRGTNGRPDMLMIYS